MRLRQFSHKGTIVPGVILGLVIGLAVAAFIAWTWNRGEPTYNEKVRSDLERARAEREREERDLKMSGKKAPSSQQDQSSKSSAARDDKVPAQENKKSSGELSPEDRERFDFYKILPGIEEARPMTEEERRKERARRQDEANKDNEDFDEERKEEPAKNKSAKDNKDAKKGKRSSEDEDQLNTVIKKLQDEGEVSHHDAPRGKSKRWLVQVGAFENEDEAERLKADLAMSGLEARILKSRDAKDKAVYRVRLGPFSGEEELGRIRSDLKQQGLKSTPVPIN